MWKMEGYVQSRKKGTPGIKYDEGRQLICKCGAGSFF
jgi:hypothetical protein